MVTSVRVREPDKLNSDDQIIVAEPKVYPWPDHLSLDDSVFGAPIHHSSLFRGLLRVARKTRSEFHWIVFYNSHNAINTNSIADHPDVIQQMERLFRDELGTPYSEPQEFLIRAANTVVVAVHKETSSIAAYCCSRFLPANENPCIPIPISFGCHEIIGEAFQGARLGSLLGALICSYGHPPRRIFNEFAVATRTNNKYIYNTFMAFGDVKRSDELTGNLQIDNIARSVISHMQTEVFGLDEEVPFDRPIAIEHEFDAQVTIAGLHPKEIIYAVSFSSLVRATLRLLMGPLKRRRKR